jgi:ketosteroid isomerase-like protein
MMASENLDLVRSLYGAWERGHFGVTEWAHPEIEFVTAGGIAPGSWTGLAGMADGYRAWLSAWDEFRVEAEEYRELDTERVLVLNYFTGKGKTSGLDLGKLRAEGASLLHIRNGKVTRLVLYAERERALADLGLAPEGEAR